MEYNCNFIRSIVIYARRHLAIIYHRYTCMYTNILIIYIIQMLQIVLWQRIVIIYMSQTRIVIIVTVKCIPSWWFNTTYLFDCISFWCFDTNRWLIIYVSLTYNYYNVYLSMRCKYCNLVKMRLSKYYYSIKLL